MADRKISDLTALTTPASGDYLPIVDISEASAANKNKRITIEELLRGAPDGTAGAPGFAFESDPDSGLYSTGANGVALSTGGTGRLFVDASGNVGIKTSAPFQYGAPATDLAHLQLTSQQYSIITFGGTAGGTGLKYWRLISRANEQKFQLQSVDDSGNNEATAIEVVKGTAQEINNIQLHTNGSERLRITSTGQLSHIGAGSTGSPAVSFNGSAPSNSLVITSAGLVGIGASSVNDLLHLRNGSSFAIRLDDTSNTHFIAAITSPDNFGNGTTAGQLYLRGAAGIGFSGNGGSSIGMVVDSSNRVGIGTTSPSSLLHLADAGNITVGTTTGTKIGTATTQKLGFYNATPVVQPAAVADATDAATVITQLNDLLAKLRTLGIIAT